MLRQPLVFTYWLSKHTVFWLTFFFLTQLPTPNCAAPLLLTGCYTIPVVTWCFPPYPSSEAENFYRGSNHSKHEPLLIYLAWFERIINNLRFIFKHVKTRDILVLVKSLIKKHKVVATLISNHESASYIK